MEINTPKIEIRVVVPEELVVKYLLAKNIKIKKWLQYYLKINISFLLYLEEIKRLSEQPPIIG